MWLKLRLVAVSYTHLDVYKRQVQNGIQDVGQRRIGQAHHAEFDELHESFPLLIRQFFMEKSQKTEHEEMGDRFDQCPELCSQRFQSPVL